MAYTLKVDMNFLSMRIQRSTTLRRMLNVNSESHTQWRRKSRHLNQIRNSHQEHCIHNSIWMGKSSFFQVNRPHQPPLCHTDWLKTQTESDSLLYLAARNKISLSPNYSKNRILPCHSQFWLARLKAKPKRSSCRNRSLVLVKIINTNELIDRL